MHFVHKVVAWYLSYISWSLVAFPVSGAWVRITWRLDAGTRRTLLWSLGLA